MSACGAVWIAYRHVQTRMQIAEHQSRIESLYGKVSQTGGVSAAEVRTICRDVLGDRIDDLRSELKSEVRQASDEDGGGLDLQSLLPMMMMGQGGPPGANGLPAGLSDAAEAAAGGAAEQSEQEDDTTSPVGESDLDEDPLDHQGGQLLGGS